MASIHIIFPVYHTFPKNQNLFATGCNILNLLYNEEIEMEDML